MLEATSEANNLASLSESKETYMRGMEEVCGAEKPFINEHVLEIEGFETSRQSCVGVISSHE